MIKQFLGVKKKTVLKKEEIGRVSFDCEHRCCCGSSFSDVEDRAGGWADINLEVCGWKAHSSAREDK